LPSALSEIPLEVAVEGADELRSYGVPGRVGIVGMSRGSELALLAAAQWPERFGAAVGIAPSGVVNAGYGPDGPGAHRGGRSMAKRCRTSQGGTPSVITVENILGPVVTLVGADDQVWPSSELIAPAMQRRQRSSHDGAAQVVFEGAGHQFFGYPGIPVMGPLDSQVHPVSGKPYRAGGTRRGDAMARDRSWVELIRIAAHLSDEAARYPPRD